MFGGCGILLFVAGLVARVALTDRGVSSVREVPVEIYVSDAGRESFLSRGKSIESIVDDVAAKLERKINEQVVADKTGSDERPFRFRINIGGMMPQGVNLDVCGDRTVSFLNDLNVMNNDKPETSVILFYTCNSDVYNPEFQRAGQETPLIVQRISTECSSKIATFVEPEPMKIEAILANALFAAAGSPLDNAVSFEEVADEGDGFQREIRLNSAGFSALTERGCYAN